jgi:PBSX family phage terminase large subunit
MSNDIIFKPWGVQKKVLNDKNRIIGAFAGKRGGKTEIGAIKSILWQEQKSNYDTNSVDPFLGVIIAPTFDMLRRLSLKKFMLYGEPFIKSFNKQTMEMTWHDGSQIYGLSADNPERIEGIKAHWIWLDEVFQMSEQLWLEVRARTADTKGKIIATGSLGVQFVNPKQHWVHHYFKEKPSESTSCYEWATGDNPHFPKEEIEELKNLLDPQTFRSMFEIDWDTAPKTAVYSDFGPDNIIDSYVIRPEFETYVCIDWGWAHELACCFFQYDRKSDTVYLFDEIIASKMTLETLMKQIKARNYKITGWVCDIAGNQEREQLGLSNVRWFRKNHDINFKFKKSAISVGISIVRSYIKTGLGQTKFYAVKSCKKSIDGLKRYKYPEKDGQILNENPIKKDDDAVDCIRYFFVNICDKRDLGKIESMKVL